jgi:hypothetical protein
LNRLSVSSSIFDPDREEVLSEKMHGIVQQFRNRVKRVKERMENPPTPDESEDEDKEDDEEDQRMLSEGEMVIRKHIK